MNNFSHIHNKQAAQLEDIYADVGILFIRHNAMNDQKIYCVKILLYTGTLISRQTDGQQGSSMASGGWGHKVISHHVITKIYLIQFLFEVICTLMKIWGGGGGGTANGPLTDIQTH